MFHFTSILQTLIVFAVSFVYIVCAPFTKVEESFAIQAVHDFLYLASRTNLQTQLSSFVSFNFTFDDHQQYGWDHENYPGVVHRTFIGPFLIAILVKPIQLLNLFQQKFMFQILARIALSLLFCHSYYRFNKAITKQYGILSGQLITVLTISQFHVLFYCSRTLPNTFGFVFVLLVYATWIEKQWTAFIFLIAFTVLVMRFETFILFGLMILVEVFYTKDLSISKVLLTGIPSGILCLVFTLGFDSYIWNKWMWPEGDGIRFNVIENKSSEWGTQPFLWYFYSAIPRLLLTSIGFLLLVPKSILNKFILVPLCYVLIYSILPHKELRFIIYVAPMLSLAVAQAIVKLLNYRRILTENVCASNTSKEQPADSSFYREILRLFFKWVFPLILFSHFVANVALSLLLLHVSSHNYPGGEAVLAVNTAIQQQSQLDSTSVYVADLAAQSGFTRFLQLNHVDYNKEPKLFVDRFVAQKNLYLILEPSEQEAYFPHCSAMDTGKHECGLAGSLFQCRLLKGVNCYAGLDLHKLAVHFRNCLNIFKCTQTTK